MWSDLGASRKAVVWSVAGRGLAITGAGIAVGGVLAIGFSAFVRSRISEVAPGDPLILLAVTGVLLVVTAIASWVPAQTAVRLDPAVALRTE